MPHHPPFCGRCGHNSAVDANESIHGRMVAVRVPAPMYAVASMLSVQLGAALSTHLFDALTPAGSAWLRTAIAAVILLALTRPRLRSIGWPTLRATLLLGTATAVLTLAYIEAVARIPLGTTAAIEFLGPLGVAAARSHRRSRAGLAGARLRRRRRADRAVARRPRPGRHRLRGHGGGRLGGVHRAHPAGRRRAGGAAGAGPVARHRQPGRRADRGLAGDPRPDAADRAGGRSGWPCWCRCCRSAWS